MGGNVMLRRTLLKGMAAAAAGGFIARPAVAADTVLKIGMSMPMTGAGFAAVGRQLKGGRDGRVLTRFHRDRDVPPNQQCTSDRPGRR